MPKFSVVISVFNKEKYIAATLQSVLAQTFQDFEIVILNDGSTDESETEIVKFKDSRISYFSEENKGAAAGRNYVIEKAKGEFVALLDADDFWYTNHLEELYKSIEQHPKESVFANGLEISENNDTSKVPYSFEQSTDVTVQNYFTASMMSSILHSSNFAINKAAFKEIGNYNENYITGEDTDFYVRLGLKYKVVFNPGITVRFYQVLDGLNNTNRTIKGKATFEEYELLEKENKELNKFLDDNRFSMALTAKLEGDKTSFEKLVEKINVENLNRKQRFLLQQRKETLRLLLKTKQSLQQLGLKLSVFR